MLPFQFFWGKIDFGFLKGLVYCNGLNQNVITFYFNDFLLFNDLETNPRIQNKENCMYDLK